MERFLSSRKNASAPLTLFKRRLFRLTIEGPFFFASDAVTCPVLVVVGDILGGVVMDLTVLGMEVCFRFGGKGKRCKRECGASGIQSMTACIVKKEGGRRQCTRQLASLLCAVQRASDGELVTVMPPYPSTGALKLALASRAQRNTRSICKKLPAFRVWTAS